MNSDDDPVLGKKQHWPLTQAEMRTYVSQLDPQLQRIYEQCQTLLTSLADTLEDDFQIAAAIDTVFQSYARRRLINQR